MGCAGDYNEVCYGPALANSSSQSLIIVLHYLLRIVIDVHLLLITHRHLTTHSYSSGHDGLRCCRSDVSDISRHDSISGVKLKC